MKRYYDPQDIRMADLIAVEKYGIPSLTLMENAGMNAAMELMSLCPTDGVFLILAGHGNNGGDGFVAARYLIQAGKTVHIITSAENENYKGDAHHNLDSLLHLNSSKCTVKFSKSMDDAEIIRLVDDCDFIADALLGTGTSGAPRGETARLISLCNKNGAVLSFDIPSGINPETGEVYSPCIKADVTVTFLAPKTGMLFPPANEMCGRVVVADIGIAADKVLTQKNSISSYDRNDLSLLLPPVDRNIHKGNRGGVLIFGGSWNYRGAPILAALGALRSGAGLVVLAIPDFMVDSASNLLPEAIFVPLKTINNNIAIDFFEDPLVPWLNKCRSVVFGPGIGRHDSLKYVTRWFWKNCDKPLLLDADALFFLSELQNELTPRADVVITPHSGEAATILKSTPAKVNAERLYSCRALTKNAGVVVLKGKDTLISSPEETCMVTEGSPALAVPGSGDVLSGSIGAFIASGMPILDAATAGVLAHATAGSKLEETRGLRGTLAREISDELPFILK